MLLVGARPSQHLGLTRTSASPARSPGPTSIRGRSARPGLIETAFDELARAGGRSSTPSTTPAATSASSCTRARTCSTARPSRCSSSASTTTRAAASTTTRPTSCCSSSTTSSSSTSTTSASRRFHVKDAEFRPTGRQGVYSGYQPWVDRAGPLPLARRRPGRLRRDLLEAGAVRLRRLGGARVGMLPQAPGSGRGRGRRRSSRDHIIRVTEKAFDDFAGGAGRPRADRAHARL